MSIESVVLPNHLMLCHPLLLPSIFPSIRVFFPMRWFFTSGGLRIRASVSASVLQVNIQGYIFFIFFGQKDKEHRKDTDMDCNKLRVFTNPHEFQHMGGWRRGILDALCPAGKRLSFFLNMFIFHTLLKVTFYLQLLQNSGYICCVVQYILEPFLGPHHVACGTSPMTVEICAPSSRYAES